MSYLCFCDTFNLTKGGVWGMCVFVFVCVCVCVCLCMLTNTTLQNRGGSPLLVQDVN
jgi:hypothetical protein